MLEGSAEVLPKAAFQSALSDGAQACAKVAEQIEKLREQIGQQKREAPETPPHEKEQEVRASIKR